MSIKTPSQPFPLQVWLGRHLVVVSALVLVAVYFQEGYSLPSPWTYLGQLGGAIGISYLLAAVITLFTSRRDVRTLTVRATSVLWVVVVLLLLGSFVPTITADPIDNRAKPFQSSANNNETMVTIEFLRERYPEKFKGKSDLEVALIAHPVLAPAMPFEEFARRLGVQ